MFTNLFFNNQTLLNIKMLKYSILHRGLHTSRRLLDKPTPLIDSIIRVDHAGELGADRIYAGQMAVLGNTKVGPVIKEMWEQEKHHKAKFEELIVQHRVRPTALTPIWNVAGFLLGAGTAMMGEKAAMACTVAVESVIVEHYNDQLRTLMENPESNRELLDTIRKFRDEEQEHHDCGIDHGAEQAPFYQALTQVIKLGCRAAISASKSLLSPPSTLSTIPCRHYSTNHKPQWDLFSAVCIERKPIITKPLTPIEQKYKDMIAEIELVGSMKSDHEIRLEEDKKTAALLKNSENLDADMEKALKQSAQDFEDANTEELNKFKFASRNGSNDIKSINRKLDQHLVLLTKVKLDKELWMLPQSIRQNNETLRDTANRIIIDSLGSSLNVQVLGNAPFGFYKYKYPKPLRKDVEGAKIFIFKAICTGGNVELNKETILDYQWATRTEMRRLILAGEYLKSIETFLIDEEDEELSKSAEALS